MRRRLAGLARRQGRGEAREGRQPGGIGRLVACELQRLALRLAHHVHQPAQVLCGFAAERREQIGRVLRLKTAARRKPDRDGEMVVRDDRLQPMCAAGLEHVGIVIEFGVGEEALCRLDARPLDAHAIAIEAKPRGDGDVFAVAVIAIARIARALSEQRWAHVLTQP